MDGGGRRRSAGSGAIPLTLCLLTYLFDLIRGMKQNVQHESEAESERAGGGAAKGHIRLLRLRPRQLSNPCLSDDKSHLGLIPNNETYLFPLKPPGPGPRVPVRFPSSRIIGKEPLLSHGPIKYSRTFSAAEVRTRPSWTKLEILKIVYLRKHL